MRNLLRAEWIKITGNRWVAGCLVWIFPVGALAFVLVVGLIFALSATARAGFIADGGARWTDAAIGVWDFPNNPVGRLILLGFTAVVFAGEYQWQTWKNVVPRNRRSALILTKFAAVGTLVVIAFVLMSLIAALGFGVLARVADAPYGPRVSGDVLRDFVGDYGLAASLAFTSTIIAAGYAALAGMFTRSILGGVLVGFGITFIENLSIVGLIIAGYFLDIPRIVHLYRLTPGYNLLNVADWIKSDAPSDMSVEVGSAVTILFSDSLAFSVAILAVWVFGLIGLTVFLFGRQDLTG